jgi:predicted RNA-binding protein with PUA-like domain
MPHWLLKTEPTVYSFDDLLREKSTDWTGVTNAGAQKNMRAMAKGDAVLIYHTGDERAAVGTAAVTAGPTADPEDPAGKRVVVTVRAKRRLATPVTLAAIKADPAFAGWDLVRLPRLSVVPVPAAIWERIEKLASA